MEAVEIATNIINKTGSGRLSVRPKGQKDIQTSLDGTIEREVKRYLNEVTPEIPFWGEETGKGFTDSRTFWVLDPIDGTVNFARELPLYAISLAMVEEGEAVVGVIDVPVFGERFHAVKEKGAFCNGERISVSGVSELEQAFLCFGDPDVGPDATKNNRFYESFLRQFQGQVMRNRLIGSAALQLAWLAAGRTDISITWGNLPWDVQAGALLVREAGGAVMDIDGSEHSLASRYTVATTAGLRKIVTSKSQALLSNQS